MLPKDVIMSVMIEIGYTLQVLLVAQINEVLQFDFNKNSKKVALKLFIHLSNNKIDQKMQQYAV